MQSKYSDFLGTFSGEIEQITSGITAIVLGIILLYGVLNVSLVSEFTLRNELSNSFVDKF